MDTSDWDIEHTHADDVLQLPLSLQSLDLEAALQSLLDMPDDQLTTKDLSDPTTSWMSQGQEALQAPQSSESVSLSTQAAVPFTEPVAGPSNQAEAPPPPNLDQDVTVNQAMIDNWIDLEKRHRSELRRSQRPACPLCEKELRRPSALKEHLYAHFNIKPYSCWECDRHYSYESSYKGHEKQVHGG